MNQAVSPFTIALAGNPNVGKSTIFNALTRLHQKTGNWAGKTVACASGTFRYKELLCPVVDLPGTYSLRPHSEEERIARDYIASGNASLLLLVCDATCPERGLRLLHQLTELGDACPRHVILCVNLCDEAAKKGITLDFQAMEHTLKIPVIPCTARKRRGLDELKEAIASLYRQSLAEAEDANTAPGYSSRKICPCCAMGSCDGGCCPETTSRPPASCPIPDFSPEDLTAQSVSYENPAYLERQGRIDRLVTGRFSGGLLMLALLLSVFWLTITGANYPSALLWDLLFSLEPRLAALLEAAGASAPLIDAAVYGVYRVVAWVVSVMLPPMAIFFPLFTLLEDLGYLPRAAFNMDCAFKKCRACGKQCLTMAMGFGCNAAGVVGCRIIDSPRERLIAILTNSLVPCNGRFPTLITLIALASLGAGGALSGSPGTGSALADPLAAGGALSGSLAAAAALTGLILLGIAATLLSSLFLSRTVLRGVPSSFTLELPPYRRPQLGKVIIRSVFDRTLFVLARAVCVAVPAGLLIWILGNTQAGGVSLLGRLAAFLDPAGRLLGLDGMILCGFLLGFPANEIVLPIILMGYLQAGILARPEDPAAIAGLLAAQGWTLKTVVCTAIFCLFHWPCSTTCLTIRKETGSLRWTLAAILLPTLIGCLLCLFINLLF